MTKVFFSPRPLKSSPASSSTISSFTTFSREIGFQPVVVSKSLRNGSAAHYYRKLCEYWERADVFLAIYPYFCYPVFRSNPLRTIDDFVMRFLRRSNRRVRSILYIVDLPIEHSFALNQEAFLDKKAYQIEKRIFEAFDILCVFNSWMKQAIIERCSLSEGKFVVFEILDYTAALVQPAQKAFDRRDLRIVYAGNWDKNYVGEWVRDLPHAQYLSYEFFGMNWDWISGIGRSDLVVRGFRSQEELLTHLSTSIHFGIIHMASEKRRRYSDYGSTSKFGTYLAAGVPILVASDCTYVASLVRKYGTGLVFDSLDEIPSLTSDLSEYKYGNIRASCLQLGKKIRDGYFFKRAVKESMCRLGVTDNVDQG